MKFNKLYITQNRAQHLHSRWCEQSSALYISASPEVKSPQVSWTQMWKCYLPECLMIIYTCIYEIHHPNDTTSNFNADIFSEISWNLFSFVFLPYCLRDTRPSHKVARKASYNSVKWMSYSSLLLKTVSLTIY